MPGWRLAELLCAALPGGLPRGQGQCSPHAQSQVQGPRSPLIYQLSLSGTNAVPALCLALPLPGWPRATLPTCRPLLDTPSPRLLQCSLLTPLLSPCSSGGLPLPLNWWRILRSSQVLLCPTTACGHGATWVQPRPAVAGPFLRKTSSSVDGKQPAQRDSYKS